MGKVVCVAGKGGTGKTTLSALIIKYLYGKGLTPILAVDADPSTNLHLLLGIVPTKTVGSIREDSLLAKGKRSSSQPLSDFLDYQIQMALAEGNGLDLLAMGRPEGKGCYCPVNTNLRESLKRLNTNYRYIVIDNEAGLEHISRQTDGVVDIMLIISDLSPRGIMAAGCIRRLIKELENEVKEIYLILNRVSGIVPYHLLTRIKEEGVDLVGSLPYDERLIELDMACSPIFGLPEDSSIYKNLKEILEKIDV